MRALAILFTLLAPAWAAAAPCPVAGVGLPALPALSQAVQRGSVTIVALGSSSTAGAGASEPGRTYPALLEGRLRAAWPGVAVRVVNAGRSGETSSEMVARIGRDVLPERPDLVIWQAGGNEALRGREPAEFAAVMRVGLELLAGLPVVLMDNQRSPRMAERGALFDAELARLGLPVFRRSVAMGAWGADGAALVHGDALHLNDRGYECLAGELALALAEASWQPGAVVARTRP